MKRSVTLGEEGKGGMDVNSVANFLMLLSAGGRVEGDASSGRVFVCKTCNRQFSSFQALGGHRASHKRPRLQLDDHGKPVPPKPKTHECPVCGLEFSIGQALGGHMRRHRSVATDGLPVDGGQAVKKTAVSAATPASPGGGGGGDQRLLGLDLNAPPVENDAESLRWLTLRLGLPVVVDS